MQHFKGTNDSEGRREKGCDRKSEEANYQIRTYTLHFFSLPVSSSWTCQSHVYYICVVVRSSTSVLFPISPVFSHDCKVAAFARRPTFYIIVLFFVFNILIFHYSYFHINIYYHLNVFWRNFWFISTNCVSSLIHLIPSLLPVWVNFQDLLLKMFIPQCVVFFKVTFFCYHVLHLLL